MSGKRVTFEVSDEAYERLDRIARGGNRSPETLARDVVEHYVRHASREEIGELTRAVGRQEQAAPVPPRLVDWKE